MIQKISSDELSEALAELKITQAEFSRMIGTTPRTISRWVKGDTEVPVYVKLIIRLLNLPHELQRTAIKEFGEKHSGIKKGKKI
jgi:transcriptional regulator with XRE-family HTH domain